MSSSPFSIPFAINIKASLQKCLLIVIPHLVIGAIVLMAPPLNLYIKGTAILLVLLSFVYYFRLHIKADLKQSVSAIRQDSAENWGLQLHSSENQDYISVALLASSFASNVLIILNFSDTSKGSLAKGAYRVLITPDSVSEDEYRRLKVRLKTINNFGL